MNPNDSPFELPDFQPFRDVLKRVTLQCDPDADTVTIEHLIEALRYADIRRADTLDHLRSALNVPLEDAASDEEFLHLFSIDLPESRRLRLSSEVRAVLQRTFVQCGLSFARLRQVGWRSTATRFFNAIDGALGHHFPAQHRRANAEIARTLAIQLAEPERKRPVALLVHARDKGGAIEMARCIAKTLERTAAFQASLEIDLEGLREHDAGDLIGSATHWGGSRQGTLTGALHKNPRQVVIMNHFDRTFSSIHAAIRPAFTEGRLTDLYGMISGGDDISRRTPKPTEVDCTQAVFIMVVSTGSEHFDDPDRGPLIARGDKVARDLLLGELLASSGTGHHGDLRTRCDVQLIEAIAPHFVVLDPLHWHDLHSEAEKSLSNAIARMSVQLEVRIRCTEPRALAAMALLCAGPNAGLPDPLGQDSCRLDRI